MTAGMDADVLPRVACAAAPDDVAAVVARLPWWLSWRLRRRARRLAPTSGATVVAAGPYVIRSPVDGYHLQRFPGEAALLRALARLRLPAAIPHVVYHRADPAVIVCRHIDGLTSAQQLVPLVAPPAESLLADCARFLAGLHAAPLRKPAFAALPRVDAPMLDYLAVLDAKTPDWLRRFAGPALAGLRATSGREPAVLLHNDFHWGNVVVSPCARRLAGVIDWTVAGVGDRHVDLRAIGCLGPAAFARFAAAYRAAGGVALDPARADAMGRIGLLGLYLHAKPNERSGAARLVEAFRPLV